MNLRSLVPVAVLVAATTASGCSSPAATEKVTTPSSSTVTSPSGSVPAGEPKTYDAVKVAVDRIDRAATAADGGVLWDTLTATGQATMSRDDYAKVVAGCPKLVRSTTVSIALNAGGTSATVTTNAGPAQGGRYTWQMVYENGHWKHQPSDGAMGWMGLGADKALAVLRNDGSC